MFSKSAVYQQPIRESRDSTPRLLVKVMHKNNMERMEELCEEGLGGFEREEDRSNWNFSMSTDLSV